MLQQDFLIITLRNEQLVIIPSKVLTTLHRYRQHNFWHTEKGGIFLGRYRGQHIEVTDITLPQNTDIAGRFFFNRCSPFHQQYANKQWQESNSEITYIGEWHTHPERTPTPSQQDISEWRSKLADNNETQLLCIIGQQSDWFGYYQKGVISSSTVKSCAHPNSN
jgi:integrative and conjugative element protein (TIGR02256 family)